MFCILVQAKKDLMLRPTDGNRRRRRQHTRWTDEMQGTLMMNWCNILTAMQNRVQWRDLIYKAVENGK
jgi:hypothetical protein